MTSRVTTAFSMFQAKTFMNFFETIGTKDSLYAITADPLPIDGDENNDILPPNPEINQTLAKSAVYENALTAVKIQASSASRITRRFDWAIGTTFVPFSNKINVLEHEDKFYCLVETIENGSKSLKVFKCLYAPTDEYGNYLAVGWNNIKNAVYKPVGDVNQTTEVTADGYIWTYMYSIYPYQETSFLSNSFMPVPETPAENLAELVEGSQKYEMSIVSSNAEFGAVYNIDIHSQGRDLNDGQYKLEVFNGYSQTSVSSAYNGIATILGGFVRKIELINAGKGYSGNISVRLPHSAVNSISILPELIVDVSPNKGHGSDPVNELGANLVMINARKYFSEDDISVIRNDFRTLAIIKNPIDETTGDIAKQEYYDMTYKMRMKTGVEGVSEDAFLEKTQSEADTGAFKNVLVVGVSAAEGDQDGTLLSIIPKGAVYSDGSVDFSKEPAAGESYRTKSDLNQSPLASDFLMVYDKPLLRKYSGEVLQLEHRKPLNRIEGQIESYGFIFGF